MSSWCLVLLLIVAPCGILSQVFRQTSYGIFLDADAAATNLHIFSWPTIVDDREVPVISAASVQQNMQYSVSPGLSSFKSTPMLVDYLIHFIEYAKSHVPSDQLLDTPIYLAGTAAMRMLNATDAASIMATVRDTLSNKTISPFQFRPEWASVISGPQQGAFAWAAAHLHMGKISDKTMAVINMGPSSVQLTFMPPKVPQSSAYSLMYADKHFTLYSHNYMGFGADAAYMKYLEHLTQQGGAFGNLITSPCDFQGSVTNEIINNVSYTFVGQANAQGCVDAMGQVLAVNAPCTIGDCGMGAVYQPPVPEMMPVSIVANFPGATQIFRMLGCASNTTAECLGNSTTVCEMTYDQAAAMFPREAADGSLKKLCPTSALLSKMLTLGFKLNATRPVHIADAPVTWALGAMTKAIGSWDLDCTMTPPAMGSPETKYAATLEFGHGPMKNDTLTVYSWIARMNNDQIPNITAVKHLSLGLDLLAKWTNMSDVNKTALAKALKPFSEFTDSNIPEDADANLHLLLDASVMMGDADAFEDLDHVDDVKAQPLSGPEHASAAWLAANLYYKTLAWNTTLPVVDLGMDAPSVAFLPDVVPPIAGHYMLDVGDYVWNLYAEKHYGFGLEPLMAKYQMDLAKAMAMDNVSSPCVQKGGVETVMHNGVTYHVPGNATWENCKAAIRPLLNLTQICLTPPCSLGGTYQPPMPMSEVLVTGAVSSLLYTIIGTHGCADPSTDPNCFSALQAECNLPYDQTAAHATHMKNLCFAAAYVDELYLVIAGPNGAQTLSLTDSSSALGALVIAQAKKDVRPKLCYRRYATVEARGILDPAVLLTPAWVYPESKIVHVTEGLTTSIQLRGLWMRTENTISVKLASHFSDCLGTAPGSPAAGRKLDPTTDVAVVGPVTQAGDYKVCFMHRKDWEPTVLTVSVHAKSMDNVLYFGAATCDEAMSLRPEYCGCSYTKPNWTGTRAQLFSGLPGFNRDTNVPAILIKSMQGMGSVMQGCCQLPAKHMVEFQEGANDYWGMCKLK